MQVDRLKIFSKNVAAQMQFYKDIIGLILLDETENMVSFQIGGSILEIEEKANATPYHFAINIPSNQDEEAYNWLKERVTVLKDGEHLIQDFDFWNAKAIYFYDADQNIVEFIARKNMKLHSKEAFTVDSLIAISEIGIPCDDIETTYNQLQSLIPIEIYDGGFERFCAIGDELGLFIAINKNVKDWFPVNDKAYSSPFEISLVEKGKIYSLKFENQQFNSIIR